jgi:hypothetical protein
MFKLIYTPSSTKEKYTQKHIKNSLAIFTPLFFSICFFRESKNTNKHEGKHRDKKKSSKKVRYEAETATKMSGKRSERNKQIYHVDGYL